MCYCTVLALFHVAFEGNFQVQAPGGSLRSVSNELLMQPRSYTKTYGDRAFAVHAPREWNLIPYEIRKSNTISSFKRSLKTYLFTKFSNNGSLFL